MGHSGGWLCWMRFELGHLWLRYRKQYLPSEGKRKARRASLGRIKPRPKICSEAEIWVGWKSIWFLGLLILSPPRPIQFGDVQFHPALFFYKVNDSIRLFQAQINLAYVYTEKGNCVWRCLEVLKINASCHETQWITVTHGESRRITVNHACFLPRARFVWANHAQSRAITRNHAQSRAIAFDHAPSSCLLWRVSGRQDSVKDTRHLSLPQFKNSNATICLLFWFNTLDVNERASLKLPEKYSHLFSRRNHANNEHTDGMSSILSFWLPQHMNVSCARIFDLFCLTPTGYYQQPWPLT